MMTSVMEKSIGVSMYLYLMLVLLCSVLCTAGSASSNSGTDINNSLNPYLPSTSGSILASSSSTQQSMLETYLQTFPINEQQNVLTTVYQSRHHASTVDVEKEKLTTTTLSDVGPPGGVGGLTFSSTTHSSATESSSSPFSQTPVVISSGTLLPTILSPPNSNTSDEQPAVIPQEHELLGCGPNNREGIGIQKALDWLREKRVSDYGWENDTHMVILAKEVSTQTKKRFMMVNKIRILLKKDLSKAHF